MFRNIVIEFKQDTSENHIVLIIYYENKDSIDYGFAIITDDSISEMQAAGHERMPVSLSNCVIEDWLHPQDSSYEKIEQLFDVKKNKILLRTYL